jgi:hypothetical protein
MPNELARVEGRDVELVSHRLVSAPVFAATTIGALTVGLGMFAVVYTAVSEDTNERPDVDTYALNRGSIELVSRTRTDNSPSTMLV